eukprot:5394764-Prymnesium_polylepis.1
MPPQASLSSAGGSTKIGVCSGVDGAGRITGEANLAPDESLSASLSARASGASLMSSTSRRAAFDAPQPMLAEARPA